MSNWTRHDTRALIEAAGDIPRASLIRAVRVIRRHYAEPGLVDRMVSFERFCQRTDAAPFTWGVADCSLLVADWVAENGHEDPAAGLRGTYDSEEACRVLLADQGGLLQLFGGRMDHVGLPRLHEPEFGAVAVIGAREGSMRQWAAIWNGRRWMVKWGDASEAHWTAFAAQPLGMWAV